MRFTKQDSLDARRELRKLLKDFKTRTVFVVQRGVSRSGMTRWLDLYLIPSTESVEKEMEEWGNGQVMPRKITYLVAKATDRVYNEKRQAITVYGCGMDMHFETVYTLSCALFCRKHYDHDKAYQLKHQTI